MFQSFYKRNQYFCNMAAMLLLLIINRFLDRLAWAPAYPGKLFDASIDYLIEFCAFIIVICLIIMVYNYLDRRKLRALMIMVSIIFVLFTPALILYFTTWIEQSIFSLTVMPVSFKLIEQYTPGGIVVILFLIAAYVLTYLKLQSESNKEKAYRAETLAKEVQLKMLRYQINPHFLFNVLNSIHSLIDENTLKAKKLVIEMSEYYRYTLNKNEHTIAISKEVESIEKYFEIQKTRYEEDFQYEIIVDKRALDVKIPSFIVHLLVENALKYGSKSKSDKLVVKLEVTVENQKLAIKVSNTGKLFEHKESAHKGGEGTGSGIENLKSRLALYFDNNFNFSINEESGWVFAIIEIYKIPGITNISD